MAKIKAVNDYGIDAEIAAIRNAKYPQQEEEMCQVWIEQVTGITFDKEFGEMLKDGVVLCKLMNTIIPGKIKFIYEGSQTFKQMENITNFIQAIRELGVPENDLFATVSLYELKDLGQVVVSLMAFGRVVQLNTEFSGPILGPKVTKKDVHIQAQKQNALKRTSSVPLLSKGLGGASRWNLGSSLVMERQSYLDAREQIKRSGSQASFGVMRLNQGSAGVMERTQFHEPREDIKRGKLGNKSVGGLSSFNLGSSQRMDKKAVGYSNPRDQFLKRPVRKDPVQTLTQIENQVSTATTEPVVELNNVAEENKENTVTTEEAHEEASATNNSENATEDQGKETPAIEMVQAPETTIAENNQDGERNDATPPVEPQNTEMNEAPLAEAPKAPQQDYLQTIKDTISYYKDKLYTSIDDTIKNYYPAKDDKKE